jgi:hypothetical protein
MGIRYRESCNRGRQVSFSSISVFPDCPGKELVGCR